MKRENTRKRIVDTFWEINKTKPIDKITVKDITEKTGIYRTTFYRYFQDIYAIVEEFEMSLLDDLQKIENETDLKRIRKMIYQSIMSKYDRLDIFQKDPNNQLFLAQYREELSAIGTKIYKRRTGDDKENQMLYITMFHLISALHTCMIEGLITFEEAEKVFNGYMTKGVLRTIDDKFAKKNK